MPRTLGYSIGILSLLLTVAIFGNSLSRPIVGVDAQFKEGLWVVGYVDPVGLAFQSGVKAGDMVLGINGEPVQQFARGANYVSLRRIHDVVILGDKGQELQISTLGAKLPDAALQETLRFLFMSLLFWAIGAFLVAKDLWNAPFTLFFIFCITMALAFASISGAAIDIPGIQELHVASFIIIPGLFVHFFLLFPEQKKTLKRHPSVQGLVYLPATLLLLTYVLFAHADEPLHLWFRPLIFLNLVVGLLLGTVILGHSYVTADLLRSRAQIRLIFAATLVGVLPFVALSALPELLFRRTLVSPSFSILAASIIPVGMVYTLVKRGLINVDFQLRRGLMYGGLVVAAGTAYAATVFMLNLWLKEVSPTTLTATVVLLSLAFGLLFRQATQWLRKLVDGTLYRGFKENSQALAGISAVLSSTGGVKSLSEYIVGNVAGLPRISGACLLLVGEKGQLFIRGAIGKYGLDRKELDEVVRCVHEIGIQKLTAGQSLSISSPGELCFPLRGQRGFIGLLCVAEESPGQLSKAQAELITLIALQGGLALENALTLEEVGVTCRELRVVRGQLNEYLRSLRGTQRNLEEIQQVMAITFAMAQQIRDPYRWAHSARVSMVGQRIANELSLNKNEVDALLLACSTHQHEDTGTLDMRAPALGLETPLFYEKQIQLGEQTLPIMTELREHCLEILESQNELYDGSGMPRGKKAEEIPLGARILAVADAFDTMTSERPFGAALTPEQACHKLLQGVGTKWDPIVVAALLKYMDERDLDSQ